MHIAVVLPPARVSNEIDTFREIPGVTLDVIGDPRFHPSVTHPCKSVRLPWVGSRNRWSAALAWLRGLRGIGDGFAGERPDLIVSIELFSVTSRQAARLARRFEIPHVVRMAEILDDNPLYRMPPWRGHARRTARSVDAVLCSNATGARHAINRGVPPDRVMVIPLGVDTTVFRPASEFPESPAAITVGELRDDKGVLDVIAAVDRAVDRLPTDFKLVVVGDGRLRRQVDALARARPWLEVRGRVPREEVADELRRATAFVLAPHSRRFWAEQFGFAVIEAMATGLPVTVTSCGALGEMVPSYNPVVAEHDLDGLADGLVESLGAHGRSWGQRNLEVVRSRFSIDGQARALGDALTGVVQRSSATPAQPSQR